MTILAGAIPSFRPLLLATTNFRIALPRVRQHRYKFITTYGRPA